MAHVVGIDVPTVLCAGPLADTAAASAATMTAEARAGYTSAAVDSSPKADVHAYLSPPIARSPFAPVATMQMPEFQLEQSQEWLAYLHAAGVVRIRGVLQPEEVIAAKDSFWDWLESLGGGAQRADPRTWTNDNFPGLLDKGFFCTRGGGQSTAAWEIRSNRRVHRAFAEIWKTEDLLTSFDTFIGWRPWWSSAQGTESWKPRTEGVHCDQNPHTKPGLMCVQGMVPLRPVTRDIGGLCVVPTSHTDAVQSHLRQLFRATTSDDWLPLQLKHPKDELNLCAELIEAEPGDLILWDSRALHGGYVGRGPAAASGDSTSSAELARLSLAVCMVPKGEASEVDLGRRQVAVDKGLTSTHWPLGFKKQASKDTHGSALMPQAKWQEAWKPPELDEWTQRLIRGKA